MNINHLSCFVDVITNSSGFYRFQDMPEGATHAIVRGFSAGYASCNCAYTVVANGVTVSSQNPFKAGNKVDLGFAIVPLSDGGIFYELQKSTPSGSTVLYVDGFLTSGLGTRGRL